MNSVNQKQEVTRPSSIASLPNECLREILLRVPAGERIKLWQVSKLWCKVVNDCCREMTTILIVGPSSPDEKLGITGTGSIIKMVLPHRNILEGILTKRGKEAFGNSHRYSAGFTICAMATDELPMRAQRIHKAIVSKCCSLRKVTSDFIDEELIDLISQKVGLQELTLNISYHPTLTCYILKPLLALKYLQKLSLNSPMALYKRRCVLLEIPIYSKLIAMFARHCRRLESLCIGASRWVCKSSPLMALSILSNLKELRITGCVSLRGGMGLAMLYRVEVLSFIVCGICDKSVIRLLRRTSTLPALHLAGTFITNQTIYAAIVETRKRNNGISLKLGVSCLYQNQNTFIH